MNSIWIKLVLKTQTLTNLCDAKRADIQQTRTQTRINKCNKMCLISFFV